MLSFVTKICCCLAVACLLLNIRAAAGQARPLLEKGWQALVRDDDTAALHYFGSAYLTAAQNNDTADKAQALLYLGICYYSVSYSQGLIFCRRAMDEYKKMEQTDPVKALEGRSRCLQLVSTIKSREGKYREAMTLSLEAIKGFAVPGDTTGYAGLIYNSLGTACHRLGLEDSSAYYHRLALAVQLRSGNMAYLPDAYLQVAKLETRHGHSAESQALYDRAQRIADSTGNRQAQVLVLLGKGEWQLAFGNNVPAATALYHRAGAIAATLTDQVFRLKVWEQLLALHLKTGNYREAVSCKDSIAQISDSMYSWERQKEVKSLEIRFEVAEKDRQLQLIQKEKEVSRLTNYLLGGGISLLLLLSGGIIFTLRRINRRDRLLLQAKDALVTAAKVQQQLVEAQQQLQEKQMQRELEFKESQLSAMTLQMLQKNELMQELKERLEADHAIAKDQQLGKIINKGLNQDKEWTDFNTYFESVNQHFYSRLKQAYPDISPNDLKICALIKLHLSIKEMAAILNISPDSVKTARYRLRKKLQMNNEDNLTDFIMGL